MSVRTSLLVLGVCVLALAGHPLLVHAMARGHIAHVLLGAGNAAPPLGAAALAVSLVVIRVFAIVLAPGLLLAALTSVAARLFKPAITAS